MGIITGFNNVKSHNVFVPVGDVTFWQEDMPIVIGNPLFRGKGIGKKVICALIERARVLNYDYISVDEIYDYNISSKKLFESCGFIVHKNTENGHSYRLML